jgi:hypothetical protein
MCVCGHNICNNCNRCRSPDAVCTAQASGIINVALEQIVATAIYPCPFTRILLGGNCNWLGNCSWSGVPFKIEEHVRTEHRDQYLEETREDVSIKLSIDQQNYQKAIFTFHNLFLFLCLKYDGSLYISVLLVGRKDDCRDFRYNLNFPRYNSSVYNFSAEGKCQNYLKATKNDFVKVDCNSLLHVTCGIREVIEGNEPMETDEIP